VAAGAGIVLLASLSIAVAQAAAPSTFVELDGNVLSDGSGTYDWANSGTLTTTGGDFKVSGTGGIFDGGHYNGATTPPTAPGKTAAALADPTIADAQFKVDPLSSDVTTCGTGDPTAYTGAGSEVNGGLLSTDTFGTASIPNKDDLSNVYATAHVTATQNEVFFGAERVINNGDSHIDFEFLQSAVTIPAACKGSFAGDRTEGDFLLSVDFTTGGTLGGTKLYQWHCNADPSATVSGPQPPDGTVCNPPAHGQSVPHYQATGSTSVVIKVNDGATAISCGGWVCRNANGTSTTQIATNELMEGGINLKDLGFTGCVSTFLPHTRSSQSFTATLKDFEIIPFNTCAHPSIATQVKNTNGTASTGDDTNVTNGGHVAIGTSVYDTATLANATSSAGGTVNYKLYSDSTCTTLATTPSLNDTQTVTNATVPSSASITLNTAGTYYFQATYSGDARNIVPAGGAKSACSSEVVVVDQNAPSISTQVRDTNGTLTTADDTDIANNGHVAIGTTAYDTAALTGATSDAGGHVTYTLYSDASCTTASTTPALSDTEAVTNGAVPRSTSVTFTKAGTYYFQASYTGDGNNKSAVSDCTKEIVVVDKNAPSIPTQVMNTNGTADTSDDTSIANNGHVAIGTSAYDTATLTGATSDAGGHVTYTLYSDASCTTASTTPALNQTVSVTNGSVPSSNSVTFSSAGTFYFQASYTGDDNNKSAISDCASEIVIVDQNSPAFHSTPKVQIKDTLSVSGLTANATGNVVVGLYSSNTCSAASQIGSDATFTAAQAAAAGGVETSFQGVLAGTYYYKVTYAGDANNKGFDNCGDESVTVGITSVS
jgi:plastocyanin